MIKNLFLTATLFASIGAAAQNTFQERARLYIQQYKDLAQAEQRRTGVPAAIKLGQGILETSAGSSELATLANNHFGIKCKKSWTGETFAHDDDAPQECFRKYPDAVQSYKDHSDYLKSGKRYASCFAQSPTDYASWAKELRKCGYATNPKYAQQLIKIIEDFRLQDHTYAAMDGNKQPVLIASAASPVATAMMAEKAPAAEVVPERDSPARGKDKPEYGKVINRDGTRGFYARKGDVLLEYAIQHKVRYAKLLEINGLPDAPLAEEMFISLEKGSRITRIIARDPSAPAVAGNFEEPAKAEGIRRPEPVLASQAGSAEAPPVSNTSAVREAAGPKPARNERAAATRREPAAGPEPRQQPATTPARTVEKPAAEAAAAIQPADKAVAAAEKPINIADELAVEEQTATKATPAHDDIAEDTDGEEDAREKSAAKPQAAEEPQDEFSRLKARLDKVVYAPVNRKPAATSPVVSTPPAVAAKPVPAPAAATAAPAGKVFHTVKSGETAFGIARQYGISMKELMTLNNLNFEAIKIGQKLRVK